MRFGSWNARSLYRTGSLKAVVRELDLVVVQEVRWDNEGSVKAGGYNFFYGKGKEKSSNGTGFFVPQNSVSRKQ
jgi:exonuclease III